MLGKITSEQLEQVRLIHDRPSVKIVWEELI